ncbi:MAG: OsmC family protein [Bacteroidetes bacterium]|nr:OsmC family protein [Bacteroidota bacterium]
MNVTHDYEVSVSWTADRKGDLVAPGIREDIEVATPPEFPKGMEGVWSPEHLFTAAVNSCLMTTFLAIADNSKLNFRDFDSKALGKLEMVDGKYLMSEVTLLPVVTVNGEAEIQRAEKVLQKAEANCLISNSITSKIIFKPLVKVAGTTETI